MLDDEEPLQIAEEPTPAQKAAATRKRNAAIVGSSQAAAKQLATAQAELDRCARRRALWQSKEDAARREVKRLLVAWADQIDGGRTDVPGQG